MKNPSNTFQRFQNIADHWLKEIDSYTPEQFAYKPSPDSWSIGQVYQHLVQATQRMQLQRVDLCMRGQGELVKGGKTMRGKMAFLIGSFPPIRVKVPPSREYTPVQPTDMVAMKRSIAGLVDEMRAASARLTSSVENGTKVAHPTLGMLSAMEWYQLIEMHFRHHLKQKRRIDLALQKTGRK